MLLGPAVFSRQPSLSWKAHERLKALAASVWVTDGSFYEARLKTWQKQGVFRYT